MTPIVRRLRRSVMTSRLASQRGKTIRLEQLESRETPANLAGMVFFDFNGDGVQDAGDVGLGSPTLTIGLDLDGDGTVDETTDTDADGSYSFAAVPDGDHKLVLTSSPTGLTATTPTEISVTVSGADQSDLNFGLQPGGSITGIAFEDLNANGTQDEGEPALAGVTVTLDAFDDGTPDVTVTTDADGAFVLPGVPDGTSTVTVSFTGYAATTTNPQAVTLVDAGTEELTFGLAATAILTGTVHADINGDGVRDAGDLGLAGILVELDLDGDGTVDASTTSAADGTFAFTGVPDGDHDLVLTAPEGYTATSASTLAVSVAGGVAVSDLDFALQPNGQVSGTVYADLNGNGVQDEGELGLPGVTVTVDAFGDGSIDLMLTTDADGNYTGLGLPDGENLVAVVLPPGFTAISDQEVTVTIEAAGSIEGQNFALQPDGRVSGVVFQDLNGNGVFDPEDLPLAGAIVSIDVGNDGVANFTVETDVDGKYSTAGILDGDVSLTVTVPPGFTATSDTTLVGTVAGAGELADQNFALQPNGKFAGVAFLDLNGDGYVIAGEPGIDGLTVSVDLFADGSIDFTTNTGAGGKFSFLGIPDGMHILSIDATGYTETTPNPRTIVVSEGQIVFAIPGLAPTAPGTNPYPVITANLNFGLAPQAVVVAGAFSDSNGNGVLDEGDSGLAGITIGLDAFNTGTVDRTLTTDGRGNVIFTDVPDGTHRLVVTVPNGYLASNNVTELEVTVVGGELVDGLRFALQPAGSLTGIAFDDKNANGIQDEGEEGLPGVTVTLDLLNDGSVNFTTVTGEDGGFAFTGIPDGKHSVAASLEGYSPTTPNPVLFTVNAANPGPDAPQVVTNLFGFAKSAVVSGVVFLDLNGNGIRDANEPGLKGITVGIDADNNGSIDFTTESNADGRYAIPGVPPGLGTISINVPAGFTATSATKLTLSVGTEDLSGGSFALQANGKVGGVVYADLNGNGQQDPGESGIPGATVQVDINGDGKADLLTQTGANGTYQFTGIPDGTAIIRVSAPTGYIAGPLTPPTLGGFVTAGGSVSGLNFGLITAAPSVLSGTVYFDLNGNGVRDGNEASVAGVPVSLSVDPGDGGAIQVIFTTTTDANGNYTFTGVTDGKYLVAIGAPEGYSATTTLPLNVPVAGVAISGLDIGIRPTDQPVEGVTGTISGTVFRDENGNGVLDEGDAPLAGVPVQVWLNDDGSLAYTTTTGPDGTYSITGLPDGEYTIAAGLPGTSTSTAQVTIAEGSTETQDLYVQPNRTLAVTVFIDLNGNGVRDGNEPTASGVTVQLDLNSDGTTDATAISNAEGIATFTLIPDGNHQVNMILEGATVTSLPLTVNVLDGLVYPRAVSIGYRLQAASQTRIAVGTDAPNMNSALVLDGNGLPIAGPSDLTVPGGAGVRVAVGDVNGDGVPDYILGTGPGVSTFVRVIDGKTGDELFSVAPFESSFTGGVFVAVGDVNGDGKMDLVITPDEGGGPRVRIFDAGNDFAVLADFYGIADPDFRGGARAALGDVTGDGLADLVVAAGFGGGPRIAAFDGATLRPNQTPEYLFNDFFVFEQTLRNGVYIAVGDIDGDGFADIIAGGGPGGGPRVYAVSGNDLVNSGGATQTVLANFFAGGADNDRTGVKLAVHDLDGDDRADIVAGYKPSTQGVPRVASYLGADLSPNGGTPEAYFDIEPYPAFTGGVFVG